jgi:hypothetical protein
VERPRLLRFSFPRHHRRRHRRCNPAPTTLRLRLPGSITAARVPSLQGPAVEPKCAQPDLTSCRARSEVEFPPSVAATPGLSSHPDEPGRPPPLSISRRHLRAPTTSVQLPQQPAAATSSIHSIRRPSCSNRSTRARFARPCAQIAQLELD